MPGSMFTWFTFFDIGITCIVRTIYADALDRKKTCSHAKFLVYYCCS